MTNALQHQAIRNKQTFKQHLLALAMCVGLGLVGAQSVSAKNINPPSLRADAPHVYVVKKGDTLWDISGRFLKTPWRWPEIWASNKHVKNPHWIYPGDRLLLCSLAGQPLIGKDEGDGCEGIIRRAGKSSNLSPQVRIESLNNMIPVIALEDIRVWLERSIVISPDSIQNLPYVLGMSSNHVLAAESDRIYIRGNGLQTGQRYDIYRQAEPYTFNDANGKKYVAAIELTQVGSGFATQQQGDITTFELSKVFNGEVRKGDLVLPVYESNLPTLFYPAPAENIRTGGTVIRVMGSIGTAAKRSTVTVDRGTLDGVQVGQVFALDVKGELTTDPKTGEKIQLPNQRAGHALIFKTFDHISYAYILDSSLPIKLGAQLTTPLSEE
ncbi:LysM peptidoglycan-binding domain-containing protein [Acinetobacter qingfengensis]|uniref:Peptidoglycan-binding protein LysM n=1 Tax=Acinetobacter qingfengensis TaxID=1262585 RepID=A0A1E7RD70_9GAMM|nr:LysM peptidoglycan-binding domain-containing protein [Acinetobacter qingfengensis]KAA8732087.1 LysM peptidoglycan-binding domain-containing protein [Acinetobacter qingfengensis]OEY97167.1 peptidoglycan-binding protein LysM [Acinetobacter qingfengensis]